MKRIAIGLILGVVLTASIYFAPYTDPRFRATLGRALDKDIIYLENGSVVEGWIMKEAEGEIFIQVEDGHYSLALSECKMVVRNYLLHHARELL